MERELYTKVLRTIHDVFPEREVSVREDKDWETGERRTWFEIPGDVSDNSDWEKVVTVHERLMDTDNKDYIVVLNHPDAI